MQKKQYNVTGLVDLVFGDVGKGRFVDYLGKDFDIISKTNGSSNSGRAVIVGNNKVIFRLLPSGALQPNTKLVIGNGVAVDPLVLAEEIKTLKTLGVNLNNRLFISDCAHLIMPYHKEIDAFRESNTSTAVGSTKKGTGPLIEDKVARRGIRLGDLKDLSKCSLQSARNIEYWKMGQFYSCDDYLEQAASILLPYLTNTQKLLNNAADSGKRILLEAAQGHFLDIDHGTYPYVTSSNASAGGLCTGSGIAPTKINKIIGVTKAYVTRVGLGPFPTEISGAIANKLITAGKEYGSVTGRQRRVGWLDLEMLKESATINGITELFLSKLDVISDLDLKKLKVRLSNGKDIFVDSWSEKISNVTKFQDLPIAAQKYIEIIQNEIKIDISVISVGPERNQLIEI